MPLHSVTLPRSTLTWLRRCSVPRPASSCLYFGDVAAGPGGFSEYILWRRGGAAKGFGFTLRGENDFTLHAFHHRAAPELFHAYYGPKSAPHAAGRRRGSLG